MARRRILTPAQRSALLALPADRAEPARHYTLGEAELAAINRRRGDRNRLGFALQLCALRYPGRLLIPASASRHRSSPSSPSRSASSPARSAATPSARTPGTSTPPPCRTRSATGRSRVGARREVEAWLEQAAMLTPAGASWPSPCATSCGDGGHRPGDHDARAARAPPPSPAASAAVLNASPTIWTASGARVWTRCSTPGPTSARTWLGWLRRPVGPASAASFHATVRARHVRAIGIEAERARRVPVITWSGSAREGERLSLGHLQDLSAGRRRGILVATSSSSGPRPDRRRRSTCTTTSSAACSGAPSGGSWRP